MILLNLPRNRQIKTETGPPVQASPANGTGGSGDENALPSRPLSRPPSGTALGTCRVMIKRASWLFLINIIYY